MQHFLPRKHSRRVVAMMALTLLVGISTVSIPVHAQKYQSRLNSLLLKKNDVYLPSRLVMGEDARFVVKAPAGNKVKVLMSFEDEGYVLPNGTPIRVGAEVQEMSGTVPENGVLELKMAVPKDEKLEGKVVYVEAVAGDSDETLAPVDIMDATGRRTTENSLVIVKPTVAGGPSVMPSMPGFSPQMMNQLSTMSQIYANKDDSRKQLLDNGTINRDRTLDKNPFVQRGIQPGIGY